MPQAVRHWEIIADDYSRFGSDHIYLEVCFPLLPAFGTKLPVIYQTEYLKKS
jgi:hypothetical protein